MKLLFNFFDTDDVIENDVFYWNGYGTDEEMPNFWLKTINLQVEWYNDDPGRGGFSNLESTAQIALFVLDEVRGAYATDARREEA